MNCIVLLCDTLRRDHCGPYHQGRPLCDVQSEQQPDWVVPTPNMDRLAERSTVFENAYNGSTPCMPARRDIYTGRYDFLERAWAPLEPDDRDLPRQISGPPNESIQKLLSAGYSVSELITDHFHLWEPGSSNYHHGYTGHEFVRGQEADAWKTAPVDFETPDGEDTKFERHFRNVAMTRAEESDHFVAQVMRETAGWLDRNHTHEDFYLHVDCFDPHEPWDPPEDILEEFDERGYDVEKWDSLPQYDEWREHYDEGDLRHIQARYAAMVTMVDRWLGEVLDAMDRHDLWEDTMVILTTDHGTFNGDHGRTGKFHGGTETLNHDACSHVPFVVHHPEYGHGERREQLVQLVDLYPTVLNAVGRPVPEDRPIHGVDLEPAIRDPDAHTRDYAISGIYGAHVAITDGEWVLHQAPNDDNEPLYWYGITGENREELGPYDAETGRRDADWDPAPNVMPTWLSDKRSDPNELENLAEERPEKLAEMRSALARTLRELDAPPEQAKRLGIADA